jgi:MoxR-like ATPase
MDRKEFPYMEQIQGQSNTQDNDFENRIREAGQKFASIREACGKVVFGSDQLIRRLQQAILAGGHILLEGMPGLAKTLLAETFSRTIDCSFQRIQFTPDLLPSDLTGGQIYNPKSGEFSIRKGPLFSHIVLADEINRASAKVQSALLESMEEKKISIATQDFTLEEPYMVIATQNPIEQEGTFPLPEAQLDRFLFKLLLDYPSEETELEILRSHGRLKKVLPDPVASSDAVLQGRRLAEQIHADESVFQYIVAITRATRNCAQLDSSLEGFVEAGASPRAALALLRTARAGAFLDGRTFITPDDVRELAVDILRHRLVLSFRAQAENVTADTILDVLLQKVPVPGQTDQPLLSDS